MPLLYLLYVAYGLVLLATPVLTIALYVRYARLRRQLNEFAEENAKNLSKLQRAVGELQSKLAATTLHAAAPPAAEKPVTPDVRQTVPVPRSFPQAQVPPLVAVTPRVEVPPTPKPQATPPLIPVIEKKPETAPEQKPPMPAPVVPVPPVTVTPPIIPAASPIATPLQKTPAPAAPVEAKPLAPAHTGASSRGKASCPASAS